MFVGFFTLRAAFVSLEEEVYRWMYSTCSSRPNTRSDSSQKSVVLLLRLYVNVASLQFKCDWPLDELVALLTALAFTDLFVNWSAFAIEANRPVWIVDGLKFDVVVVGGCFSKQTVDAA